MGFFLAGALAGAAQACGDVEVLNPPLPLAVQSAAGSDGPLVIARGDVTAALVQLPVVNAASDGRYGRSQFGPAWSDIDRNGCDTRNDILRRDLQQVIFAQGSMCVVQSGILQDPYTGANISFRKGRASGQVQIDHIVALAQAWRSGAATLTPAQRLAFANDPLNLLAVAGQANQDKSDADAATWLPPDTTYRCSYIQRQISVKTAYRLSINEAELRAMRAVLTTCGPMSIIPSPLSPPVSPSAF